MIYFLSPLSVVGYYPEDRKVYPCLSPCDGCKNPAGVMMGLTENVQACLRIFRRAQHQWLSRDICIERKGFLRFLSYDSDRVQGVQEVQGVQKVQLRQIRLIRGRKESLSSGVLPSRQRLLVELYPRALPPVTHGSALQAPERMWILMLCLPSRHQSACEY